MNSVAPIKSTPYWRVQAAAIVAELFSVTPSTEWDDLLDLHQGFLAGKDWDDLLDLFLACRTRLEADHYLPFYRLRRLVEAGLQLNASFGSNHTLPVPLRRVLLASSLKEIQKRLARHRFEHDLDFCEEKSFRLEVSEMISAG